MAWLSIVFSVLLTFPFGNAEATALSTVGGLTFEVRVEVFEPASAVLVRGKGLVDELPPVSLVDQEDGTWAGIVEMPIVEDILIGFELIPLNGPSVLSGLHPLTDYGIDSAVFELGRTPDPVPIFVTEPASPPDWLWLILAGGAGVLALVLIWLWVRWGGGDEDGDSGDPAVAGDGEAVAMPDADEDASVSGHGEDTAVPSHDEDGSSSELPASND
jgi:hypothetical protein